MFKVRCKTANLGLRIRGQTVALCAALKYLGVVRKSKGAQYYAHFQAAADKARRVMTALYGLIRDPQESRKLLLTSVVHSVLLYGTSTWATSLRYNRRGVCVLVSIKRRAAKCCVSADRTISHDTVTVVA